MPAVNSQDQKSATFHVAFVIIYDLLIIIVSDCLLLLFGRSTKHSKGQRTLLALFPSYSFSSVALLFCLPQAPFPSQPPLFLPTRPSRAPALPWHPRGKGSKEKLIQSRTPLSSALSARLGCWNFSFSCSIFEDVKSKAADMFPIKKNLIFEEKCGPMFASNGENLALFWCKEVLGTLNHSYGKGSVQKATSPWKFSSFGLPTPRNPDQCHIRTLLTRWSGEHNIFSCDRLVFFGVMGVWKTRFWGLVAQFVTLHFSKWGWICQEK